MEQLSFDFMKNSIKEDKIYQLNDKINSLNKIISSFESDHPITIYSNDKIIEIKKQIDELTESQLIQEADALADVHLNISGMDALCMAARGDFYDTDLEGSILHSNLRRIASLLKMY